MNSSAKMGYHSLLTAFWRQRSIFFFLSELHRIYQDFDDPQIFQYTALIDADKLMTDGFNEHTVCTGSSLDNEEEALAKCLLEACERKANMTYKNSDFVYSSYDQLRSSEISAADPTGFTPFSGGQLRQKTFAKFRITKQDIIPWKEALHMNTGNKLLIPAELGYFNFKHSQKTRRIMIPISTGAAAGADLNDAIEKGIYEIIERDAFMIRYLSKKAGLHIADAFTSGRTRKISGICKKYRLTPLFYDITVDMPVKTILAILINDSPIGPSVSLGLKTHHDEAEAVRGAFVEALQTRTWMRRHFEDLEKPDCPSGPINTFEQRGMYWYKKDKLRHLDFFLKRGITKYNHRAKKIDIVKKLIEGGHDIYVFDLTPEEYKTIPLSVVKVVIPDMVPLYLDEKYPYWGSDRLRIPSRKINRVPHPFL